MSSENSQQEIARRVRELLTRDGITSGNSDTGIYLSARAGQVFVTLGSGKMCVYFGGACVYTEDGEGRCTGISVPYAAKVLRELRQRQVLDDLANI